MQKEKKTMDIWKKDIWISIHTFMTTRLRLHIVYICLFLVNEQKEKTGKLIKAIFICHRY